MCLQFRLHWNQAGYASDVYHHLAESVSQSCHLEESCLVCLFCCRVNTRHPRLGVTLEAARHNKWRPPLRTTFSRSIKAAWNSSSRRIGSSTAEAAVKRTLSSGQLMFRNKRSRIQTRVSLKNPIGVNYRGNNINFLCLERVWELYQNRKCIADKTIKKRK